MNKSTEILYRVNVKSANKTLIVDLNKRNLDEGRLRGVFHLNDEKGIESFCKANNFELIEAG